MTPSDRFLFYTRIQILSPKSIINNLFHTLRSSLTSQIRLNHSSCNGANAQHYSHCHVGTYITERIEQFGIERCEQDTEYLRSGIQQAR